MLQLTAVAKGLNTPSGFVLLQQLMKLCGIRCRLPLAFRFMLVCLRRLWLCPEKILLSEESPSNARHEASFAPPSVLVESNRVWCAATLLQRFRPGAAHAVAAMQGSNILWTFKFFGVYDNRCDQTACEHPTRLENKAMRSGGHNNGLLVCGLIDWEIGDSCES